MRRAAKVDANQPYVVSTLRWYGLSVHPVHTVGHGFPDLLVGGYNHHTECDANLLVELKATEKDSLTEMETEFFKNWKGPKMVAWIPEQILRWFGLIPSKGETDD